MQPLALRCDHLDRRVRSQRQRPRFGPEGGGSPPAAVEAQVGFEVRDARTIDAGEVQPSSWCLATNECVLPAP